MSWRRRPLRHAPKYSASDTQPRLSSHAPSHVSKREALPAEKLKEPSAIMKLASGLSTSGKSNHPTNLLHSGELHKIGLQLASKISQPKSTGKAKAETPKPAKFQTAILGKGSSSTPLSTPLRELQKTLLDAQKDLEKLDYIDSASVLDVVRQWGYTVRRLAQSFEKAEKQRIADVTIAIDRDEKLQQLHTQQLATKDAELAETVEQCMAQIARCDAENTALLQSLKKHQEMQLGYEKQLATSKKSCEEIIAQHREDIEDHYKKEIKESIAHALEKKDEEMKQKLRAQREEMEEMLETKTAAWKKLSKKKPMPPRSTPTSSASLGKHVVFTPETIELKAKKKYDHQVKYHLLNKDEEIIMRLASQEEGMAAGFGKTTAAWKQEYEKMQSDSVATQLIPAPLTPSPSASREQKDGQVATASPTLVSSSMQSTHPLSSKTPTALMGKQNSTTSTGNRSPDNFDITQASNCILQGKLREMEEAVTGLREQISGFEKILPLSQTDSQEHRFSSPKQKLGEDDDALIVNKTTSTKHKRTGYDNKLTSTGTASLKRKRTADDDEGDGGSATIDLVSPKRPRTMLTQIGLESKALDHTVATNDPRITSSSELTAKASPEHSYNDTPELDRELSGIINALKSKHGHAIAAPAERTPNITKVEGLWSTSYHGLPPWKSKMDDMTVIEVHELSPSYNPPPPAVIFHGLPQWKAIKEDEEP